MPRPRSGPRCASTCSPCWSDLLAVALIDRRSAAAAVAAEASVVVASVRRRVRTRCQREVPPVKLLYPSYQKITRF
eukprot:3879873-Prymnesium_polylepis.1